MEHQLYDYATRNTREVKPNYRVSFLQWSAAFSAFLKARSSDLTPMEKQGVAALQMRKLSLLASLARPPSERTTNPMLWDRSEAIFREIVALAKVAIGELECSSELTKNPSFSVDFGIVGGLFDLVCQCRDPLVRREGIRLLRVASRHEGLWNGDLAAQIAQRVVELEEGASPGVVRCCKDVPEHARIFAIILKLGVADGPARLRFMRLDVAANRVSENIYEDLEW